MNAEQAQNRLNEIRDSLQSSYDELTDELQTFRSELTDDPTMESMELFRPTLSYLVNGRDEASLLSGVQETTERKACLLLDNADEIRELEVDLCTLICEMYREDLLSVPLESHRIAIRGDIPHDREERFAFWNETLKPTIVEGFDIESTNDPFSEFNTVLNICDSVLQEAESTSNPNPNDDQIDEPTPVVESESVRLYAEGSIPIATVNGVEVNSLQGSRYSVIRALLELMQRNGGEGCSIRELEAASCYASPNKILKRLAEGDELWASVIHFPERKGAGGYRIL